MASQAIVPEDIPQYLEAYYFDDEQAEELTTLLYEANKDTYERVAREELKRLGNPFPFMLTAAAVLALLRRDAQQSAESIVATFNRELTNAAKDIVNGRPRVTKAELVASLGAWVRERQAHKGPQVAVTEAYKTQQRAIIDFYEKSGLDAKLIFTGSLKCPICQGIAAKNPYTIAEAKQVPVPVHVHCGDAWVAEFSGNTKGLALWLGK